MNNTHSSQNDSYSTFSIIKFILPSLLGIFLFMLPINLILLVEKGLVISARLLPVVEMMTSSDTGRLVLRDLLPVLFSIFLLQTYFYHFF